jgi:hypothetical protein
MTALAALGALAVLVSTVAPLDAAAAGPTVSAAARARNPVVTGDTWVTYGRAGWTQATVHGTASGVAAGAVARLVAQPFPFHAAGSVTASAALSVQGSSAPFRFSVAPEVATRYRVEVFASSADATPEAVSAPVVVYATSWGTGSNAEVCNRVTCTLTVHLTSVLPRSTIAVERHKHEFTYLDLVRSPSNVRPRPTTYTLVAATVRGPRASGHDLRYVITIVYHEPPYSYWYFWETCTRDTLGKDGLGLPGSHGCGTRSVSAATPYLG